MGLNFSKIQQLPEAKTCQFDKNPMELGSVIGSDLFEHDNYIKSYLQQPDLQFISKIKIGIRYYVTPDLILQLSELKNRLGIPSFI